jgi:hypothetical protein
LRNYIDNLTSSTRRTRKRVQDNSQFVASEKKAPANAPKWTLAGYNGSLSSYIEEHIVINDEENEEYVPPEANEDAIVDEDDNENEADNTVGERGDENVGDDERYEEVGDEDEADNTVGERGDENVGDEEGYEEVGDENEADNTIGERGDENVGDEEGYEEVRDEDDRYSEHSNRSKSVVSEAYDSLTD